MEELAVADRLVSVVVEEVALPALQSLQARTPLVVVARILRAIECRRLSELVADRQLSEEVEAVEVSLQQQRLPLRLCQRCLTRCQIHVQHTTE